MLKRSRQKKPAWEHFNVIGKNEDSHPHVQCKYCSKNYKRAVPGRMQAHLDNYCKDAPNNAKSQSGQQNTTSTIDEFSARVSDQQKSFEISLVKALTSSRTDPSFVDDPHVIELFRLLRPSFKLPNGEDIKLQMNDIEQSEFSSSLRYRQQQQSIYPPMMGSSEEFLDPNLEIPTFFQQNEQNGQTYDYPNYPNWERHI